MIKKSLLTALILLVFYLVLILLKPSLSTSQHQWQDNVIKAQKFIYDDKDTLHNIILGSSLSNRLNMNNLPGFENLSFGGQSVYDGLKILLQRENIPKNVFIEMNVILRKENVDFTSSLTSPILYYVRKNTPILKEEKQPIALFGNYLNETAIKKVFNFMEYYHPRNKKDDSENSQTIFFKMIGLHKINYSEVPDDQLIAECFSNLNYYVDQLSRKNINVIFFEMPVDKELRFLPKAIIIRKKFHDYFPPNKFKYIYIPDDADYKTTDGIHLKSEDALKYCNYLKSSMHNW